MQKTIIIIYIERAKCQVPENEDVDTMPLLLKSHPVQKKNIPAEVKMLCHPKLFKT